MAAGMFRRRLWFPEVVSERSGGRFYFGRWLRNVPEAPVEISMPCFQVFTISMAGRPRKPDTGEAREAGCHPDPLFGRHAAGDVFADLGDFGLGQELGRAGRALG